MLRPMVAEYELFVLGVVGSSNHVVSEGDLDGISGSILLCVNYLGIDLSCCYLLMAKHLADSIDVRAISQLQGSIGMAKAVENIIHLRNWKNIENKPVTGCELVDFLYFTSVAEKQSGMEY